MSEWHYAKNGQQFGPINTTQLKQLAAQGQLAPTDMIWKEGMAEWVPAGSAKGLFPQTAPAAEVNETPAPYAEQPTAPISYYNPTGGLQGRVALTFRGFPTPTGPQSEWPLTPTHLSQFKETEKHRKDVRTCAVLFSILGVIYAIFAVIFLIAGLFAGSSTSRGSSFVASFSLAFCAIMIGLAVLAFFARKSTFRCRKWGAITFIVLFSIGALINIASAVMKSSDPFSDGSNSASTIIGLMVAGLCIYIMIRGVNAMPKFLACPVWAQEALVNAKL